MGNLDMAMVPQTGGVAVFVAAGALLLLAGRRLFWLFVGVVGFLTAFQLAPHLLAGQKDWVVLVVALAVGVAGAVLAVLLQWLAAGAAGFLIGGAAALLAQQSAGSEPSWLLTFLAAVVGAAVVMALFDWALIFLSSLAGAAILLAPWGLTPVFYVPLLLVLLVVGIGFQGARLRGSRPQEAT